MDELNLKTLEQIPIPEGLEERLSAKIDEWEQEEKQQKAEELGTAWQGGDWLIGLNRFRKGMRRGCGNPFAESR